MASDIDNKPARTEGDDIEALEAQGLHVVPDVGDPGGEQVEGDIQVTPENVEELFLLLEQQNQSLLMQLGILGKGINPLILVKIQLDTLIDFTMGDDAARKQYETACSMRLNEQLKLTLAQLIGADVE